MNNSWQLTSPSFKAKIIGKLLGDGCITIQKGRKPRFQFIHAAVDYEWSNYCYEQLFDFLPLNRPKFKTTIDPRLKQGYSLSYYVQSRTADVITYLRSEWYSGRTKVIPFDLLNEWFTRESLAWWYMDDGHLKQKQNRPQKIILSTDSFTKLENQELANLLKRKYNLKFRLDKQNRLILYDQFQIQYFLYLVTPHLHPSMHRKIISSLRYKFDFQPKRTSIYLPSTIKLIRPTREINFILNHLDSLIMSYKNHEFYERYFSFISKVRDKDTRSYQIVLSKENLAKLHFLKEVVGLNFSELTGLCFG